MTKEQIIEQLKNDVYCRLKPSKISGVGVFAIRDIPAGIDPFKESEDKRWIQIKKEELTEIHPSVLQLIQDLYVFNEGVYWIPEQGAHTLSIAQFLNHSENPNLDIDKDGEIITTKKEIKEGEELTVDYRIFNEGSQNF